MELESRKPVIRTIILIAIIMAAEMLLLALYYLLKTHVPPMWHGAILLVAVLGILGLAVALMLKLAVPRPPEAGRSAALSLWAVPGECQTTVHQILLPDGPVTPGPMSPGSAMLLCMSAAALCQREPGPVADAMSRCLQRMGVNAPRMQKGMPLLDTLERDGLTWQLHRDGSRMRAFACGEPAQVLSLCGSMLGRAARPMSRTLRTQLLQTAQEQDIPPLCFATASWDGENLGEPMYLGTFLLREEAAPEALQEIDLLRSLGLTPFVHEPEQPEEAARMNRLLSCEAGDPAAAFHYRPRCQARLSEAISKRQRDRHALVMCGLQIAVILQLLGAMLLITGIWDSLLYYITTAMLFLLPLSLSSEDIPSRRIRPWDMLQLALSTVISLITAWLVWWFTLQSGAGSLVARCTLPLTIIPFLYRCVHALLQRWISASYRRYRLLYALFALYFLVMLMLAMQVPLLNGLFALAAGSCAAVLGYLLCRVLPRGRR